MNAPSWIGRTLGGRYQIEQLLGQGGMSAVYKASDPNLRRVVAVKLIHTHLSGDPRFLHRFEEEAAAVAQLRHPNIVQVYDFNQDEGTYYMVMEFIPGETLQDQLRRYNNSKRLISLEKVVRYTMDICAAVGYAHKRGLIHRDIKPANIMIDVHDQAILMDFGIVKMVGAEKFTATGAVVGTALYMPPEVIRGEVPDSRSDIYSLGVTLYEMISGKPPFEADSAMTLMMMHLNDPLPDLTGLRPEVSPALVSLIEKSLAKDRSARFSSAEELGQTLQALQPHHSSIGPASSSTTDRILSTKLPVSSEISELQQTEAEHEQGSDSVSTATHSPNVQAIKRSSRPENTIRNAPTESNLSEEPGESIKEDYPGASASQTTTSAAETSRPASLSRIGRVNLSSPILIGAALTIIVALVVSVIMIYSSRSPSLAMAPELTRTADSLSQASNRTQTIQALAGLGTATLTSTSTISPSATNTQPPTRTPTPTSTATRTATATPDLFVVIKGITIDNSVYSVDYETFGYTEKLPGMHVHFFFNTVLPENAGMPGSGPWKLYGGPRPFRGYLVSDRPAQATMMCALVANADHSVIQRSGTCFNLP